MFKFLLSIISPSKEPEFHFKKEVWDDFICLTKGMSYPQEDLVDMLMTSEGVTKPVAEEAILFLGFKAIDEFIMDGKMVYAIKLHRRITNMGLKESKNVCDERRDELVGNRF